MIVGVDYDTFKATLVALPFVGDGPPVVAEARYRAKSAKGDALDHLDAVPEALAFARMALLDQAGAALRAEPNVYFIERGFGMSRRADFLLGAFLGAIFAELRRSGQDEVNLMDLREWKKQVTADAGIGLTVKGAGNGNAKKEVANEAADALIGREWPGIVLPDDRWTPDALDAFGIAYTGRILNAKGRPG